MHGDGKFIEGSVRVVDYDSDNNNILVRGSYAFEPDFQISKLIAAIQQDENFSKTGITLNQYPQVIDFCLIGFVAGHKDARLVDQETRWFTDNTPKLNGEGGPYPTYIPDSFSDEGNMMVFWPIQAIGGKPPTTAGGTWNASPASSLNSGTGNFDYKGLIPAIRAAVTNDTASLPSWPGGEIKDAIIYLHCDSGVNRTGAAVCGYLMCYGTNVAAMSLPHSNSDTEYSLQQAQAAANAAPPSNDTTPPGGCDVWVTQAYCNFLRTNDVDGTLVAECIPSPKPI